LRKIYFSSHKLPKQQSTNFWSQGILGVNQTLEMVVAKKMTHGNIAKVCSYLEGIMGKWHP
jgi:hypothetical protein